MKLIGESPDKAASILKREADKRQAKYRRRDDFFELYDKQYYLQHYGFGQSVGKIQKAKGEPLIQVNDATNVVDFTVGLLASEEVGIEVYARQPDEELMREAEDVERFFTGIIQSNDLRQGENVLELGIRDACHYGWGVWYCWWDNDLAELYQVQTDQEEYFLESPPIVIERIAPSKVYPEIGGPKGRYKSHLIIEMMTPAEIEDKFDVKPKRFAGMTEEQKGSPTTKNMIITYWGWEKITEEMVEERGLDAEDEEGNSVDLEPGWYIVNAISVEDESIKEPLVMDGYKNLPILPFFYRPTGSEAPDRMGLSSIFPIHLEVFNMDKLENSVAMQVYMHTNAPWFHEEPLVGGASQIDWDEGLGQLIPLQQGEKIRPPVWEGNPPDIVRLWEWHKGSIRDGSYSSLAEPPGTSPSGLTLARQMERDTVRLTQVRRSISMGYRMLFGVIRDYVMTYAPNTPITTFSRYRREGRAVKMTGAELAPLVIEPSIEGRLPLDPMRAYSIGMQLINAGDNNPFPDSDVLEKFFYERQPQDIADRRHQERIEKTEFMMALGMYQAAVQQGMIDPTQMSLSDMLGMMKTSGEQGRQPERPSASILPGQETQNVQRSPLE